MYKSPLQGKCKKILLVVVIVSGLFNVIAILPYVKPYYNKIERKYFPPEHFSRNIPDEDILNKVCVATLQHKGVKMSMYESKGLFEDIKSFLRPTRNTTVKNNFYTSYAMVGLSYYAMQKKDSMMMNKLRVKTDDFLDISQKRLNYQIEKIDQMAIGILLLNLYKYYKCDTYLEAAHKLFSLLKAMREKDGTIMYVHGVDYNYVDALGMYVPFLMEYFNVTGDSLAYQIADYNMKTYYIRGVNHKTGIPVHGYNIRSGIHVGSANWGRGIGWYLLAAAFCPQIDDPILRKTLSTMDYTQFPGNSEHFDSSTALMCEIYKQSKNKSRKLSLDFIKPHILANGFVDDCSGDTYDFNSYSHTFGESELCNGLLLMLASRFANIHL